MSARARSVDARGLTLSLALGGVGFVPVLGMHGDDGAVLGVLAWLALIAASSGALAAACGVRFWPLGLVPPAAWAIVLALVSATGDGSTVPSPGLALLAWSGLHALGFGAQCWVRRDLAAPLAVAALALAALPFAPLLVLGLRPTPAWSGRLLDASPVTFVVESAGIDWARQPWVYERAGGADLGPGTRVPWSSPLAAGAAVVVGCVLATLGERRSRRPAPSSRNAP